MPSNNNNDLSTSITLSHTTNFLINPKIEEEKTRFVGKHSRDHALSLYLLHRTITESSSDDSSVEPLQVIIRTNPELGNKRIYLGVIGRLVCDYGLQLAEHIVFQTHIPLNFSSNPITSPTGGKKTFAESVFDTETKFITVPDQLHQAVLVRLPPGMPPSTSLLTNLPNETWGLTYYLCAFTVEEKEVNATCWDLLKIAKSKAVLSFAKRLAQERMESSIPASVTTKRTSLTSSKGVTLTAVLNKTCFLINKSSIEDMLLNIKLLNPARSTITGFKINLKQIVTVRFAGEARQTIKSTFAKCEFHSVFAEGDPLNPSNTTRRVGVPIEDLCRDACSFADTFTIKPKLGPKLSYQLALQATIPKSTTHSLSPTLKFDGLTASIGGGLDKLRCFSVEYYANVHAVFKWSRNLIAKLPFTLYDDGNNFDPSEEYPPINIPRQPSTGQRRHYEGFSEADMDANALNLLSQKPSQIKHVHRTLAHEDLLDLADDGDDLGLSRTPSTSAFLHRRESLRGQESSDDEEDDDGKRVTTTQNQLSWEEDLQIAMSELSMIKRAVTRTSSNLDSEVLELEMFESCNDAMNLAEQVVKQKPTASKLVNHITDIIIPLSSALIRNEDQKELLDQWIDTIEVLFSRLHYRSDSIEDVLGAIGRLSVDMCPTIRDSVLVPMSRFASLLQERQCCSIPESQYSTTESFQVSTDASEFATAFQTLVDALLSPSDDEELLPKLQIYLSCLYPFFVETLSSSPLPLCSIAAYWHYQFALLAISTCFSSSSSLLLPLITPISWSPSILAKVPSFYTPIDAKSFPTLLREQIVSEEKWQSRLVLCGNLVIESMKCL